MEIVEGRRAESLDELGADAVVIATDGYPSGLLGDLEGLIVPTRGQVIATEPIPERLFEMPHYGRHGFDYWHQTEDGRIVAGGFRDVSLDREFTAEEALTDDVQQALSAFVDGLIGPSVAGGLPLGRDLRARARLHARRRARCPVYRTRGSRGATPAMATSSGSPAAASSHARSSRDRDPLLDMFQPARLLG